MIRATAPDLVLLQEATRPQVVAQIAEATGMSVHGASPGHSTAFMGRVPVDAWEWHHPWRSRRAFLEISLPGPTHVYVVHLSAIHSNWTERRRVKELEAILERTSRRQDDCHVVVGDFNTLAPGAELEIARLPPRLRALVWLGGGRVRWQTIQIMLAAGYVDAFRLLNPDDEGFTFPAADPHVRLDYLFMPARFAPRLRTCEVYRDSSAAAASDHLPLVTTLSVTETLRAAEPTLAASRAGGF
jgi:endonuclease/exonuclease/phosphatase family metal-dependent hydrolase